MPDPSRSSRSPQAGRNPGRTWRSAPTGCSAIGGFDPATGAGTPAKGGDDLIAFLRTIVDGGTLVYEPGAVVRHWHRRDYQGMRRQAFGYGMGLGAYLTAAVWRQPALLASMLRRAERGRAPARLALGEELRPRRVVPP